MNDKLKRKYQERREEWFFRLHPRWSRFHRPKIGSRIWHWRKATPWFALVQHPPVYLSMDQPPNTYKRGI